MDTTLIIMFCTFIICLTLLALGGLTAMVVMRWLDDRVKARKLDQQHVEKLAETLTMEFGNALRDAVDGMGKVAGGIARDALNPVVTVGHGTDDGGSAVLQADDPLDGMWDKQDDFEPTDLKFPLLDRELVGGLAPGEAIPGIGLNGINDERNMAGEEYDG